MNKNQFDTHDFESVEFHNQLHPRLKVEPVYFNSGFSPQPYIYGRSIVLSSIIKVLEHLPSGYGILVWDVYRSRATQAALFDWMREEIKKKMPHLSDEENFAETRKFVALPSALGDDYCAPHLSGGAIDLTLFDVETGLPLDMGTPFDECSDRAHRDYFDLLEELTPEDKLIRDNRRILRLAMEGVGFTSYQYEWWHYDMGNFFWSLSLNQPAVFGPLFGDKEWPE
ncbi:M15 family metallopeptidase [Legionella bononiensis]|uniref:D-alanyl-D-alanine dipeptidase n=1 Tax=Legionella bononiensis TaxID=2793102 RepID=A0ABS1WFD0_9GAMM|nr:M15 family metallopeptidase [Legionella bononiensis]MBL7479207.1 D-alanyl-D-alanine dipeptidase [Legionella bononiensis]MBL7528067.1 D-alanyl-D-alanine dipeptidase [Legionella bononiensis]MBL7563843.1 D-alanyl-D-alanine dipeptidase [Legionella bononiensis]